MINPSPKAKQTSAPAATPISSAEAKTFCRVDHSQDDTLIAALITAATTRVEELIDQKLINQTWDIYFDHWPYYNKPGAYDSDGYFEVAISEALNSSIQGRGLELPFGPISTFTSVKTYDDDNTEYTMDTGTYMVDTISSRPKIALLLGETWPTTVLRPLNGIKVTAIFGYGASGSSVPEDVKNAIKMTVAHLYENRGDVAADDTIPPTALLLLEPYRRIKVA